MRLPRVLLPADLEPGAQRTLSPHAQGHLVRVLRLRAGALVRVFDGQGAEALAELLDPQAGTLRIVERCSPIAPSPLSIVLVQALARGEKMDLILQKATELGVRRVLPVHTERSEVKLDEDRAGRRLAHWQGVLAGACEQCGRADLPQLDPPQSLGQALVSAELPDSRWFLDPEAERRPAEVLAGLSAAAPTLLLAIGPEGGFGDRDLVALRAAGCRGLRLGPRVLRTETAGLAALAVFGALAGDLG
ncbi:MAG: 16S rRNA (uracil(1498)-N(3))-methyltransferase [Xanthomonadales bacterium]|jgi:16S rRNA (uracil1498-N3)-methyltransferase|nr:16S rRNA (uracil(1498)-N(3))-methyltransferase [Xanthomonadales bacterium]